MPDPVSIGAMKAFALGRRAKWKDYVDLYFILQKYPLEDINKRAKEIFGPEFDQKIFREQLAFHEDINYSDAVIFMPGFDVAQKEISDALIDISTA